MERADIDQHHEPHGWLAGESIVVTGAGSGIGRAVVSRFINEGARVCAMVRSESDQKSLEEEFGPAIIVSRGDVRSLDDNRAAVARAVNTFGKLDCFVANAGVWDYFETLERLSDDAISTAFDEIFAINVKGGLLGAKASVEALRASRGSMIFTISNAGFYAGGGGPLYVASKHAQVGLVRQLAFELAPDIRVNAVAPGGTKTRLRGLDATGKGHRHLNELDGLEERIASTMPLAFMAEPEDHSGFYLVLASRRESSFATATIIQSDGGWEVRRPGPAQSKRTQA